ncbi:hypothetical protein FACS189431_2650 [Alphaproteobacteria bacterium]|nr:hypothetical protein FACS189431_2650 [Alphaproteobacteria bacterium]
MQIQKNRSPRRALIAVIVIIVLAALGIGGYFVWKSFANDTNVDDSTSDSSSQTIENVVNNTTDNSTTDTTDNVTAPTYIPGKTPIQYDGQTEESPNPNCIDAACSNFELEAE